MGVDGKYGKVTVEKVRSTPIGEDEPVVVFRAQDKLLPRLLGKYYVLCQEDGCSAEHLKAVHQALRSVTMWQDRNPSKRPGDPVGEQ